MLPRLAPGGCVRRRYALYSPHPRLDAFAIGFVQREVRLQDKAAALCARLQRRMTIAVIQIFRVQPARLAAWLENLRARQAAGDIPAVRAGIVDHRAAHRAGTAIAHSMPPSPCSWQ